MKLENLNCPFHVSMFGAKVIMNRVCKSCILPIDGHECLTDSVVLDINDSGVILGFSCRSLQQGGNV